MLALQPLVPADPVDGVQYCDFAPPYCRRLHGVLQRALAPLHFLLELLVHGIAHLDIKGVLLRRLPVKDLLSIFVFFRDERLKQRDFLCTSDFLLRNHL